MRLTEQDMAEAKKEGAVEALRQAAAAWSSPICCATCMYVAPWLRDRAAALGDAPTETICVEFVDTGKCGHTDAEHDALVDQAELREAERTAAHWEGLWQVAIERAEAAERKVAAADVLRKRWARDARDGEARGSSYCLTYREAANDLKAALRGDDA